MTGSTPKAALAAIRKRALSYPETVEDHPWGDRVIKVRGKIFVFLGAGKDGGVGMTAKLPATHALALTLKHVAPTGYGLGNAGTIAVRLDVPIKAGESDYTELGVETGLVGMVVFAAWGLTLLWSVCRAALSARDGVVRAATAGIAAAFAAVLVLAVQTDIDGVPWVALSVWTLAGAACCRRRRRSPVGWAAGDRGRWRRAGRPWGAVARGPGGVARAASRGC